MKAVQLYYAAFSAALMAKAEPALAQQLAYQLAYLAFIPERLGYMMPPDLSDSGHSGSGAFNTEAVHTKSSGTENTYPITSPHRTSKEQPRRWPINPLNHVDWLGGGRLNERWLKQQKFSVGFQPLKRASSVHEHSIMISPPDEHRIFTRLNDAIMRALVQSDPDARSKFAVALFACLCHHQWPDPGSVRENYWLIMHSIRCYLYGTRMQWSRDFATNTEVRQSRNPMYRIVSEFLNNPLPYSPETALRQVMMQLGQLPPILQAQCLELGIVYRETHEGSEITDKSFRDTINQPALQSALQWFWAE
ncbi:hypothetical protein [Vibrio mangrovi]|uniref:Uncharacterized protein n=1 Tax=Vibrio mangrovi TaxID=474394 RepID=A0A1Y6IR02_9VIBR|nr:hypothetical protein [Vibrio mangrovi]MDW6001884.1 hypothetical protein [Vibrio mangrovi]SMS00089.1 hypothetical protein VIM7927_01330 [Vibrio mangrovi]